MGEKSNQIERQIVAERGELGQNLNELQRRVEQATDWRFQFQKRPMLMMGVALGGGLLLASVTGRRSSSRRPYKEGGDDVTREHRRGTELQKTKALETFDTIKGAMVGVAANTFKDLLGQLIPGFHEQFEKQRKKNARAEYRRLPVRQRYPPALNKAGIGTFFRVEGPMGVGSTVSLLRKTYSNWSDHHAPRLGASVAFYTLLSFAPLLVLTVAFIALVLDQQRTQAGLIDQARR